MRVIHLRPLPSTSCSHTRVPSVTGRLSVRRLRVKLNSKDDARTSKAGEPADAGLGLKTVWYAAENFGKLVAFGKKAPEPASGAAGKSLDKQQMMSREDAIAMIREDYDKDYFISGVGDMAAYAPDCEFSDPFVAFRGVDRFKTNVGNLGRLMSDIKLDVYEFAESGSQEVRTRWRFSCLLDLPWRPRIAAAGNTTHVLDPDTGLCVKHIERWEVEPEKVIAQLFRPANRVPENAWETLVLAISDKDVTGVWWVLSPLLLKLSIPLLATSVALRVITGEGLPGPLVATGAVLLAATSVTQVIKFAQGMQGGDTGTGGRF